MKTELKWSVHGLVLAALTLATFLNGVAILNLTSRIVALEHQQKDGWWNNLPTFNSNHVLAVPKPQGWK